MLVRTGRRIERSERTIERGRWYVVLREWAGELKYERVRTQERLGYPCTFLTSRRYAIRFHARDDLVGPNAVCANGFVGARRTCGCIVYLRSLRCSGCTRVPGRSWSRYNRRPARRAGVDERRAGDPVHAVRPEGGRAGDAAHRGAHPHRWRGRLLRGAHVRERSREAATSPRAAGRARRW